MIKYLDPMSIKKSLSVIFSSFVFSLILLVIFLFFIDPLQAGIFGLILFFLNLFLCLLSLFFLLLVILGLRKLSDDSKIFEIFVSSFRRGTFLALFLTIIFLLKLLAVLYWWNAALSFLLFVLLEIVFSSRRKKIIYLDKNNVSSDSTN